MRTRWVIVVAAALLGLAAVGRAAEEPEAGDGTQWELRTAAHAKLDAKEYEEAMRLLDLAGKAGSDDAWHWNERGRVLWGLERHDEAIDCFTAALERDPDHGWAVANRGILSRDTGDMEAARRDLDRAVERKNPEAQWVLERGILLRDTGDAEGALRDFERAIEMDPLEPYGYSNRGWLREGDSDFESAVADYSRCIIVKPDFEYAYEARARCHEALDHPALALEDLWSLARIRGNERPADLAHWRRVYEAKRDRHGSDPDLDLLKAEIEDLREIPFTADVDAVRQTPEQFGERIGGGGSSGSREAGLVRLGLLRKKISLGKAVKDALMSQAAAYYDPDENRFYYLNAGEVPHESLESTAAHELVHALQDQITDLSKYLETAEHRGEGEPRNDDRIFAARCVMEGEATFVQMVWQLKTQSGNTREQAMFMSRFGLGMMQHIDMDQMLEFGRAMTRNLPEDHPMRRSMEEAEKVPPYVLRPLFGAYLQGAAFVAHVQGKGGWKAVERLYSTPPTTAEQCLHPNQFVAKRDQPTPLRLPAFTALAGDTWRPLDHAVHGELYIQLLLTEQGIESKRAREAARGWDGDIYRAWRGPSGGTSIVFATTWDSEEEAEEFTETYLQALHTKYEGLVPEAQPADVNAFRFNCGEGLGTGVILTRGREVFAVEGFDAGVRKSLLAELQSMSVEHVD